MINKKGQRVIFLFLDMANNYMLNKLNSKTNYLRITKFIQYFAIR